MEDIILTKKVSKHGNQSIIILPKFLEKLVKPQDLVQIQIKVLNGGKADE